MAIISKKKIPFQITDQLWSYLEKYGRAYSLPISYDDLHRYDNSIAQYDGKGQDTLWETVFYSQADLEEIQLSLKKIYALMKADGDLSVIEHLFIDRVDLCVFGNTKPFRIRIVNRINDNFDYFYVKHPDASRIYGLELEHLLSPNKLSYLVSKNTLIEEHIVGIPGDQFIETVMKEKDLNKIRLAKEFVKFNERCFVRLLGDMHASNFVVDITPDFDEVHYRIRAIDFDQQSYEGRIAIYMPKYFKQNNPIIKIGLDNMTPETMRQYQREERVMIANRIKMERERVKDLLDVMKSEELSTQKNVETLRKELSQFYDEKEFLGCKNIGEVLQLCLEMVFRKPYLYSQ